MSRYDVPASNPNHEIVVGYDPPLETYFIHVTDTTKDEDDKTRDVLWIGTTFDEILDVEVLDGIVQKFSKNPDGLSQEIFTKLYDDAD